MKTIIFFLLIFIIHISAAWAEGEAPTPAANRTAIELVQSHADYV